MIRQSIVAFVFALAIAIASPSYSALVGQIDFNMNGLWFVAGNGTQSSVDVHLYAGSDPFLDWSFYAVTPDDVGKVYVMPEPLASQFVSLMTDNVTDGLDLMVGGAAAGLGEDSIWNYDGFLPLKGSLVHPEDRTGTADIAGINFSVITFQLTRLELIDDGNHYWHNYAEGTIALWDSPQVETGIRNPPPEPLVPEPSTWFSLLVGYLGLVFWRLRKFRGHRSHHGIQHVPHGDRRYGIL